MTKEQIIKDQFPNDEFLQGGVLQVVNKCTAALEEENKKLKKRFSHDCPSCVAFGKHCPHKVNGDPYFYDCYLTVKDLEKENKELKDDNKVMADNYSKMESKFYDNLSEAKEIIRQLCLMVRELNKPNVQLTNIDYSLSEAEEFLKEKL